MGVNLRAQLEEERLVVKVGERSHRGETVVGPAYRRWEDDTFGVDVALLGRWGMFSVGVLYQDANEPEIFGRRDISNLRPGIAIRPDDETIIAIDMYDALGKGNVSGFLLIGLERQFGNSAVRAGAYSVNPQTWEPKVYTLGIGHRIIEWEGMFANIELNYTALYRRDLPPDVDRYTHKLGFAIRFH